MQGPGSAPQYMAPSFNNVQPRTREERALAGDKTHLEKMRIGARPGHSQPPGNVLIPVPNSALYIDEHSRFAARDAAALEHARRQEQLQKKEVRDSPALCVLPAYPRRYHSARRFAIGP